MRYPPIPADEPPCSEYRSRMRERLSKRSYFQATVASWDVEGMQDPSLAASTIATAWPAIELLFDAATSCLVFGEDRLAVRRLATRQPATYHTEWPAWAAPRARSAFGRTLQLQEARAARDFMSTAFARGVVQLFCIDRERLDTEGLLKRLCDPIQVNPPFGSAPDAAKRYVRKVTPGQSPHVLLTRNAYGLDAEFHGPAEVITEWFDRMLTIGHRTAGFERGNCQYYVRPFEVGSTLLWEGVSRKRHGLEVATERIAAAERDPNATERTTPHALAAAELLAALAGRPPRIYTEEERDLDWRIAAWMKEKRGNFSITRDDLALARRALEAILARSVFPDMKWRTLPPKVKWEQTTRELLDRIAAAERDAPA